MTVCPRCVLDAPSVCLCLLDCGRHEDCAGRQAGEPLRVRVEDGEVLLTRRLGTGTATDHLTPAQALNLCRSLTAAALEVLLGPPERADEQARR